MTVADDPLSDDCMLGEGKMTTHSDEAYATGTSHPREQYMPPS